MKNGRPIMDLAGQIFGGITALRFTRVVERNSKWLCKCHCGKEFEASGSLLRRNVVRSCGCNPPPIVHGHTASGGMSPEYQSWRAMIQRCTNPKNNRFQYYGARGIAVCERWETFSNFLRDMGPKPTPKHSLERVENDKGYSPDNCKWATALEQRHNRRDSVRSMVEFRKIVE